MIASVEFVRSAETSVSNRERLGRGRSPSPNDFGGTLRHRGFSDPDLDRTVRFRDGQGTEYTHLLGDLLGHVINHSTYRRRQLATQMRQLGEAPPGNDLILYLLEKD